MFGKLWIHKPPFPKTKHRLVFFSFGYSTSVSYLMPNRKLGIIPDGSHNAPKYVVHWFVTYFYMLLKLYIHFSLLLLLAP